MGSNENKQRKGSGKGSAQVLAKGRTSARMTRPARSRSHAAAPARRVATAALAEQRTSGAYMRDVLDQSKAYAALDARDAALARRLCLGVVATAGTLDEVLGRYTSKLEPKLRDALRLSTWELIFAETPAHIAVSQGVDLAAEVAPRARGLANAVLRRIAEEAVPECVALRERASYAQSMEATELARAFGLPAWLVARVEDERGEWPALRFAASMRKPAPMWVRLNRLADEAAQEDALKLLEAAEAVPALLTDVYRVGNAALVAASSALREGVLIASDLSAQQVAAFVEPAAESNILEVGQGRGTKTLLLQNEALAAGGLAHITAIDSSEQKLRVARPRVSAYCADAVRSLAFDGTQLGSAALPLELDQLFDTVFIDAPCSGSGTLRRHPEIAWSLEASALDVHITGSLVVLQQDLLQAAATRVAPGGTLVYATCSVFTEENEAQVEAFLASEIGRLFSPDKTPFQALPALDAPDGHFCARLIRRS